MKESAHNGPSEFDGVIAIMALARMVAHSVPLAAGLQAFLDLVKFAAARIGRTLLEAANADDLDDRIDAALEGGELQHVQALLASAVTPELCAMAGDFGEKALPSDLVEALGLDAAATLHQAFRHGVALADAVARVAAAHQIDLRSAAAEYTSLPPLFYLSHPKIHPRVARALLANDRSAVCGLAVVDRLLSPDRTIAPWLIEAILERWVRALKEYLRLVASLPGAAVPDELVPPSERLDLEALAAEQARVESAWKDLADRARQSGAEVYPPPQS